MSKYTISKRNLALLSLKNRTYRPYLNHVSGNNKFF